MLEIVWRNPNRLVRARVIVDKTSRLDPETGEPEIVYHTTSGMDGADIEYEVVVSPRQPVHAA